MVPLRLILPVEALPPPPPMTHQSMLGESVATRATPVKSKLATNMLGIVHFFVIFTLLL
jgi:hypothetical protein